MGRGTNPRDILLGKTKLAAPIVIPDLRFYEGTGSGESRGMKVLPETFVGNYSLALRNEAKLEPHIRTDSPGPVGSRSYFIFSPFYDMGFSESPKGELPVTETPEVFREDGVYIVGLSFGDYGLRERDYDLITRIKDCDHEWLFLGEPPKSGGKTDLFYYNRETERVDAMVEIHENIEYARTGKLSEEDYG